MKLSDRDVIVIEEFVSAPAAAAPDHGPIRRWRSQAIGGLATVILHLLVAAPMVLGFSAHKSRPQTPDGVGSTAWASQGERVESMILIDLSALYASEHQDFEKLDIEAEGIQLEDLKLALVSADLQPPAELLIDEADLAETANEAAGDPAGHAALFGKYMGQVSARIERAWMRPRTEIETGRFDCRARVTQDRSGNVLAVNLDNCGGNERWNRSLTSAILRASPLSAPPEPWLFTETLTLTFAAEQYVQGRTPEYDYEPVMTRVASVRPLSSDAASGDAPPESVFHSLATEQGDIDLTITGSDVRISKKKTSVTTPR
jgi:hypothetical protein